MLLTVPNVSSGSLRNLLHKFHRFGRSRVEKLFVKDPHYNLSLKRFASGLIYKTLKYLKTLHSLFLNRYKSNEDYVYVRGRGRGKYICEECGIRCKKPSMLKKHIRTHTDVRPYVCKLCNFAFKTKGTILIFLEEKIFFLGLLWILHPIL